MISKEARGRLTIWLDIEADPIFNVHHHPSTQITSNKQQQKYTMSIIYLIPRKQSKWKMLNKSTQWRREGGVKLHALQHPRKLWKMFGFKVFWKYFALSTQILSELQKKSFLKNFFNKSFVLVFMILKKKHKNQLKNTSKKSFLPSNSSLYP